MHDLIIVGGRVAGSSVAMLAARAGFKVLLVERRTFPADTLSTNYIHQPGCARLASWGLLDEVIASGCPPIEVTRFQFHDVVIEGGVSPGYSQVAAYAPRRFVLDTILMNAARAVGVEVREATSAIGILEADQRCVGVKLRNASGDVTEERCRLLVGADGMRSSIARLVKAEMIREEALLSCVYYAYWQSLDAEYELFEGPDYWVGAVPTNDAVLVAAYFPQEQFDHIRRHSRDAYLDSIRDTAPDLSRRMEAAQFTGKLWGTGEQRNFFRKSCGRGWALVGDAGHHKDSITARGITDALTQAELLVSCLGEDISDPAVLDSALRDYCQDRDGLMLPGYEATLRAADISSHENLRPAFEAIAADFGLVEKYFDVVAGIRSYAELTELLPIATVAGRTD